MNPPRIRVYMGCSLDGAIAGPNHELSFLHGHATTPGNALHFEDFMAQVGAMVMGRSTYDMVEGMGVWPYGDIPVLVATHRPLHHCLLYTSPSPRDATLSRMPSSA